MVSIKYSLVKAFILLCCVGFSQQKSDTVALNEVSITDYRIKKSDENFSQTKTDSTSQAAFLTSSMAQMLLQQNGCLVKAYGPNNIASLGIRGSTAQQTAVV